MKPFNTIYFKIILGIIITVSIVLFVAGIFTFNQINTGFQTFLTEQENEGYGLGKNQNDTQRIEKHTEIINNFRSTISNAIIISSITGFTISLLIGLIISRQISHPISQLKQKISSVSQNKYDHLKMNSNTQEVTDLIDEFNTLIDELKRIEQLREDLVSDVAHELKTPITKIRGQVEGCIDGIYTCDKNHLNKVLNNIEQLEGLISQLQHLVQIKSKSFVLKKEDIELKDFIDSIISGLTKTGVKINNNVNKDSIIYADKKRLREIIDNIISNSIKYTEKGSINIDYKKNTLIISDTGKGISEKDIPYIFERFYRADKSRSKSSGGLGLGLAIVKELAESHGWRIKVSSELNKGTTFSIYTK